MHPSNRAVHPRIANHRYDSRDIASGVLHALATGIVARRLPYSLGVLYISLAEARSEVLYRARSRQLRARRSAISANDA